MLTPAPVGAGSMRMRKGVQSEILARRPFEDYIASSTDEVLVEHRRYPLA